MRQGPIPYRTLVDPGPAAPKSTIELAPEVKEPALGPYGAASVGFSCVSI
jgi:hypothetical protein